MNEQGSIKQNKDPITIIKLGGALITDDSRDFTTKPEIIENIADQIIEVLNQAKKKLILIHGAGSFGHVHAAKYKLNDGYNEKLSPGLVVTHDSMLELNQIIRDIFAKKGMKLLAFPPMTFCIMTNGRVTRSFSKPIEKALELGFLPVLFGDVAFDTNTGYKILSGDQLPIVLFKSLQNVKKIIFLTNVDGVFDCHPELHADAHLIKEINVNITDPTSLFKNSIKTTGKTRVTGEMEKKVEELYPLAKAGKECWIINSKDGRLKELLQKGKTLGTRIYSD
ncbi:MAG: isopentenyl phosphate kinase [Candidatus Hodarchaeales archaeon]|jgi:isopentenyl phosphate kinase